MSKNPVDVDQNITLTHIRMHLYFSGIGGAGLSPLALLALDCGYQVSGSDAVLSLGTQAVQARGISITIGQSYQEIQSLHARQPIDWLVVTSALPPNHPHLVFAKENNIKLSKRHELINLVLSTQNLKMIAVAGTHGKTTTTGMLVWLFQQLGIPVSYAIGSNISFGASAAYQSGSRYFVYEADEFDRNFLNFQPYVSLVTSLDYDHADTYPTRESYLQAFADFIQNTQLNCHLYTDNPILSSQLADSLPTDILKTKIITHNPQSPESSTLSRNTHLQLPGKHNRANAYLALMTAWQVFTSDPESRTSSPQLSGINLSSTDPVQVLAPIFNSFPGTERRFQKLIPNLYTDYAHHPVEIAATLQLAKEVSGRQGNPKVVVVYQPHQNLRQHALDVRQGYKNCFQAADHIFWLPTYLSRENPDLPILSPAELVAELTDFQAINFNQYLSKPDRHLDLVQLDAQLAQAISHHLDQQHLVVCMGAGDIDSWIRKIFCPS